MLAFHGQHAFTLGTAMANWSGGLLGWWRQRPADDLIQKLAFIAALHRKAHTAIATASLAVASVATP